MAASYAELSQSCFKNNDYEGYLEYARKQFDKTQSDEDREAYETAKENCVLHKEIQDIINSEHDDYYKILRIPEDATIERIKRSFRALAFRYHPSKTQVHGANSAMRVIQKAYFEINTEEKRAAYDRRRRPAPRASGVFRRTGPFGDYTGGGVSFHYSTSFDPSGLHPSSVFDFIADHDRFQSFEHIYRALYRNARAEGGQRAAQGVQYAILMYVALFILIFAMI